MKLLYTALVGLACSTQVFAQTINETFENYSSAAQLSANCWSLYGADLTTTNGINSAKGISIVPATSNPNQGNSNVGQIVTPFINLVSGTTATYQVRLSSTLSTQALRIVSVRTLSLNGTSSDYFSTFTLNRNSSTTAYTVTITMPVTGVYKLIFDITGGGDGNTWTFFDNFVYNSTYNTSYGCNGTAGAPLPVRLTTCAANLVGRRAQLTWSVTENETGDRFEIEKSADGRNFSTAVLLFNTSKAGAENYTYTEPAELKSVSYFRIRIVNKNNSVSYSRVLALRPESGAGSHALTLLQNPVKTSLGFQYQAVESGSAQASVYTTTGVRVLTKTIQVQAGNNSVAITLDDHMPVGTYVLEVFQNGTRHISKLVKN